MNPPVLVVSLDGVAPRFATPERMPHLGALVRQGAGCFAARTVEPPWTRPVHASMLRGVDPTVHGSVDNSMTTLTTDAPSMLAVARTSGRTTASVVNWRQLDSLIEPDASEHRVFIDAGYDPSEDELMVDLIETLLRRVRPDVMFAYLCRADLAGHEHGWGSDAYLTSLTTLDATLGRLLRAAGDDTDVLITTDHGGSGTSHGTVVDDVMDIFVAIRSDRIAPGSMWTEASTLDVAPTVADLAGFDADARWQGASLLGREQPMLDHLLGLLRECERHSYGENLSMLAHALQSAAEIAADGADDDLIVAALLHDIGHLGGGAGAYGDPDHAESGARFLRPWLPATITEPIRLHVEAKRHMVGTDPEYAAALSDASRITLGQQGGPFDADESARFLADPHAERAMWLRRCDDQGKRPGLHVPALEEHRARLAAALASAARR